MSILFFSSDKDSETILQELRAALPTQTLLSEKPDNPDTVKYAIVWNPPIDFFDGLEKLEAIFSMAAGVDHILDHPGLPQGVPISRLEDAGMGEKIAEYALYGVLHAQRSMQHYRNSQHNTEWNLSLPDRHAKEFQVGILGLGQMGKSAADKLLLNGYPVKAWTATEKSIEGIECFYGTEQLPDFCAQLDVLVCLLPLTPQTRGILNASLFAALPRGAFLINAARGPHLVDQALIDALNDGQISGALLDVTHPEPLPSEHPFWSHSNIILTPHIAAPTQKQQSISQLIENIKRCEKGETPRGLVEPRRGY